MIDALAGFGIADALDVSIVAALLYAGISWLRRSQAALVALGMGLLGIVYLTARMFDLQLTTWVFHGFFAAAAVTIDVDAIGNATAGLLAEDQVEHVLQRHQGLAAAPDQDAEVVALNVEHRFDHAEAVAGGLRLTRCHGGLEAH